MKVLGIEFASNQLTYALIEGTPEKYTVAQNNRLVLTGTRSRDALVAFQDAVITLYNACSPDAISIKEKPESGQMQSGAAALKMEGIAIANSPCDVEFVSGAKINACNEEASDIPKYYSPAFKAAFVTLSKRCK
ncbi:MAG: DUF3010 family protein [Porticoccaceae bacterium]